MRRNSTALARNPPCLGMSDTCDCNMCSERRRKRIEVALLAEERARDGVRTYGLAFNVPSQPQLPLTEATPKLKRRKGELTWGGFWEQIASTQREDAKALAEAKKTARRCGFTFTARMPPRAGRRVLTAAIRCPDMLGTLGYVELSERSPMAMAAAMYEAFRRCLQLEREETERVAQSCGFVLTEAKPKKGMYGSWTACSVEGSVPLNGRTPDELRQAMRHAANAARAPQVEATRLDEDLPQAADEDVVEEPPATTEQRSRARYLLNDLMAQLGLPEAKQGGYPGLRARGVALEVEVTTP